MLPIPFSSFRFTCGRRRRSHECGLNYFSSPSKGAGVRVSLDVSRASLAPPGGPARSLRMQFCRYARMLFFLGVDCACRQVSHLLRTLAVHVNCLIPPALAARFTHESRDGFSSAASDCLAKSLVTEGNQLPIGPTAPARDVILDYVSPIAPPGSSLRALSSPPMRKAHWGGDN